MGDEKREFRVGDRVRLTGEDRTELKVISIDRSIVVKWPDGCRGRYAASELILVTPSWLPLEPGKFYRLREGRKYHHIGKSVCADYCYIGECLGDNDTWHLVTHTHDGAFEEEGEPDKRDIIGPWIDKPEMDFSVLPEWWKSIAKQSNDEGWLYSGNAIYEYRGCWANLGEYWGFIPPEFCPKWEGSWDESLVVKED